MIYFWFSLVSVSLSLTSPMLTRFIINYIDNGSNDILTGIGLTGLCLLQLFISNLLDVHCNYRLTLLGFYLTNDVLAAVARKGMNYPSLDVKQYSTSDMSTLATIDAVRFSIFAYYASSVIFLPIQITIGIFLMY